MSDRQDERRRHYRIRFPFADRPELQIGDRGFEVTELSESGMRMLAQGDRDISGDIVGRLRLSSGEEVPVKGVFQRREENELIIGDLEGITFALVLGEQRRLRNKYPEPG